MLLLLQLHYMEDTKENCYTGTMNNVRKEGRKEGRKDGRKEGWKKGRKKDVS